MNIIDSEKRDIFSKKIEKNKSFSYSVFKRERGYVRWNLLRGSVGCF